MPLVKDKVAALEISDELKADIMELFGQIDAKENEVSSMRGKLPTDSQKVVESTDFEAFEKATKELGELKQKLADKIQTETTEKESGGMLAAFPQFFE